MSAPEEIREIETPTGTARAHLWRADDAHTTLVASHGSGGGIEARDLQLLPQLVDDGITVVLVEQPWRVAGRKLAPAPKRLDEAWVPILADLKGAGLIEGRLVVGGRSAGARVACRTAQEVGADAVLPLAFPLHPPGKPEKSRAAELLQVLDAGLPLHVVQGRRDTFGRPEEFADVVPQVPVTEVDGPHGFAKDPQDVLAAVRAVLGGWNSAR